MHAPGYTLPSREKQKSFLVQEAISNNHLNINFITVLIYENVFTSLTRQWFTIPFPASLGFQKDSTLSLGLALETLCPTFEPSWWHNSLDSLCCSPQTWLISAIQFQLVGTSEDGDGLFQSFPGLLHNMTFNAHWATAGLLHVGRVGSGDTREESSLPLYPSIEL